MSFGWRWLANFSAAYPICIGWRRLSTESAGDGEKRRRLTGLADDSLM